MESEDNFKIGDQDFGECSMLSVHATYVSIRATCKMIASEKLCLQWNDFKDNVSSSISLDSPMLATYVETFPGQGMH